MLVIVPTLKFKYMSDGVHSSGIIVWSQDVNLLEHGIL